MTAMLLTLLPLLLLLKPEQRLWPPELTTASMWTPIIVPRTDGGNTSAITAWPFVRKEHSAAAVTQQPQHTGGHTESASNLDARALKHVEHQCNCKHALSPEWAKHAACRPGVPSCCVALPSFVAVPLTAAAANTTRS